MLRRLLPVCALLVALAIPAGAQALTVGISDQTPATFSDPLFAPMKFTVARYVVPYDVATDTSGQKQRWETWLAAARAAHQKILVSFEHSRKSHSAAGKLPSTTAYKKALTAFKKLWGTQVSDISPWNEVDKKFDASRGEGQPTWNKASVAAQYYGIARKLFVGKHIVALDILDQNNVNAALSYIKKFKAALKKYKIPAPKIWGFHPYSDINRFSSSRTKAMLKATGSGDVWLTEASGIVKFGSGFPYDVNRAAKADKCMFTIAKSSSRIKRLYFFGWPSGGTFDSGVLNPDGSLRPGYAIVQHRTAGACKK
jgi:hypothetical protein